MSTLMTTRTSYYYLIIALMLSVVSCKESPIESPKEDIEKATSYDELHRPQYHFTPEKGWMNDPNGLVYKDGEYHLFYQYYPNGITWDSMHWGHAVSPDMIQWQHLPIALYPDDLGYIFSGSAVVDHNNTSGLGTDGKAPMIAIFTHHDMAGEKAGRMDYQNQSIAYSNDNGRSWTKYEGNPVVKNPGIKDFRDPKVIWDNTHNQWIMVFAAHDKALFYTSPNLIDWKRTGEFGIEGDKRLWECPDIFPMRVKGTNETKWVLITSIQKEGPNGGTATSYFIGDWDGRTFNGDPNQQKWIDYGTDNYALVTWSDIPEADGRRLALGWMSNWQYALRVPATTWRSAMTLPRELQLLKSESDYEIINFPPEELLNYESKGKTINPQVYTASTEVYNDPQKTNLKINLSFTAPEKGIVHIRLSNNHDEHLDLGYNISEQTYFIDRTFAGDNSFSEVFADYHSAPAEYEKSQVDMTIYVDQASVELFADGGKRVMTDIVFPQSPYHKVSIMAETNDVELIKGEISEIKSIW